VAQQVGHHLSEAGTVFEHDVGGNLGLIDDPVVAAKVGLFDSGQPGAAFGEVLSPATR
jgi:hypothetical protein